MVGAEPELAGAAVHERVGEAADVAGGDPDLGVEDDRRVEEDDVLALLHHRALPLGLHVLLEQDAVVAVVEGRAEAAVDVRARVDEAAAAAQRGDLLDRRRPLVGFELRHGLKLQSGRGRRRGRGRGRAPRRLGRDGRDRDAGRRRDRGAVPGPAVPHRAASAGRDGGRSPARRSRGWRIARAVVIFTLVEPTLRSVMRELCDEAGVDYCDLLSAAARGGREGVRAQGGDAAARPAGARRGLLQADRRDRVRGQERRRARRRASGRRRRARRRLADVEDAALDLSRLPRVEGDERPAREGDRATAELFEIDPSRIVGLTIEAHRLAEIRSERIVLMGGDRALRRPERGLRGPRARRCRPQTDRLPGDRRLRALDRGDRPPDRARGRGAHRERAREAEAAGLEAALGALVDAARAWRSSVFYGLFTPFWFALRSLAWLAEFRARRRK